jgi:hypothetical protein
MLTEVLKGNPRQVKRFLNTFMIRKKLSEIAGFGDVKLGILAKLMVLEYLDIERFRNLFEWQQRNEGISVEIAEMEMILKENGKEEFGKKYPNWLAYYKWVNVEPPLTGVNLADYFWLTRDAISSIVDGALIIPIVVRQTLDSIESCSTDTSLRVLLNTVKSDFSESDLGALFKLLKHRLLADVKNIKNWKAIFTAIEAELPNSDNVLINILKEVNWNEVSPGVSVRLSQISKHNPSIEKVFSEYCKNDKLTNAFNKQKEKR